MNEDQIRIQAQHDAYSRTLENNRVRQAYRQGEIVLFAQVVVGILVPTAVLFFFQVI
jgi:hypothetical protein